MREYEGDSRDLAYENADKSPLCDVGKSPELVQRIEDLPDDIPANDPRVELIVKSLLEIDASPIEKPVSLRDLNESIKGNIAGETKISIYEGEWPDMRAKSSRDIIRQYAGMNPKTSPPIRSVDVVVDYDGRVFLALQGDGAHRLCAAKMRGDHEILCREISIVRLN